VIGLSDTADVQNAFRALADPTRRKILLCLSENDMTIREVCGHFDITRAAIKKHLNILEEGALISVHVNGRERVNRLEPQSFKSATEWLNYFSQFWNERLNKLEEVLEREETNKKSNNRRKDK